MDQPVTDTQTALVTPTGQTLQQALPDEGVSFVWENSDFHYLTKWWEGLLH